MKPGKKSNHFFSTIQIIYNPNSTGNSQNVAKKLADELKKNEINATLVPTKYAGHAEALAYQAAKKYENPLIVSSSGDGGYNEVINGVMKANRDGYPAVSAVLPAGNANDHSRVMHDGELAAKIIKGKTDKIDVLQVEFTCGRDSTSRYAHSYAGIGLSAVVATELNTKRLNPINEKIVVLGKLIKYRPFVIIRGGKKLKLDSLIFANINQMAKFLTISEQNTPRDGKFEVVSFPYQHKLALVKLLVRSTVTSLTPKSYKTYDFVTPKRMIMQLDGEILNIDAGSRVKVSCRKRALTTVI